MMMSKINLPCRSRRTVMIAVVLAIALLGREGATAYDIHDDAIRGDNEAVFSAIAKDPGLLEIRDQIGASPLYYAAWHGHTELVRGLIERGAEVTVATTDGLTPLHWAALGGHVEICRMLIDHGAVVNYRSIVQRNTPLHEVWNGGGSPEVARLLVQRGADVNATEDWYGMTPLHYAVVKNLPELAEALIESGADTRVADRSGRLPASYARTDRMRAIFQTSEAR
jgi:serine/threonine-protein phosphatase 6 regulatory ankyrin repeat subunit B